MFIWVTTWRVLRCLLIVCSIPPYISCEYDCVCNYNLAATLYPKPFSWETPCGYMYAFECLPWVSVPPLDLNLWVGLAFRQKLCFIQKNDHVSVQKCQGELPEAYLVQQHIPIEITWPPSSTPTTSMITTTTSAKIQSSTIGPTSPVTAGRSNATLQSTVKTKSPATTRVTNHSGVNITEWVPTPLLSTPTSSMVTATTSIKVLQSSTSWLTSPATAARSNATLQPTVKTTSVTTRATIHSGVDTTGLWCLSCDDVVAPTDCATVKMCGIHESCFVDVYVSDSGLIRYHMGCRDTRQCAILKRDVQIDADTMLSVNEPLDISTIVSKITALRPGRQLQRKELTANRRLQKLLVCTRCCSNTLCNSEGCGNKGYSSVRGPVCFSCQDQKTPEDCDTITICGLGQACMLLKYLVPLTYEVRYRTVCADGQTCRAINGQIFVGKRTDSGLGGSSLAHCCTDDLCNRHYSSTTEPPSTHPPTTVATNPCLSNPCHIGTCSVYSGKFACSCPIGYWGRQCEFSLVTDACASNPCVWGTCTTISSTYRCYCDHGYHGTNCDQSS